MAKKTPQVWVLSVEISFKISPFPVEDFYLQLFRFTNGALLYNQEKVVPCDPGTGSYQTVYFQNLGMGEQYKLLLVRSSDRADSVDRSCDDRDFIGFYAGDAEKPSYNGLVIDETTSTIIFGEI